MRISFFFIFFYCCINSLQAQYALKAVKYFNEGDITKGIERLERGIEKNSADPANYYVTAILYSSPDFYEETIDSAYFYLEKVTRIWPELTEKQQRKYRRKGMDSLRFKKLALEIDSLAFDKAQKIQTSAAFNHFLAIYEDALQREEAISIRNKLAYSEALAINKPQALEDFFIAYPNAPQAEEARAVFENLYYEKLTATKSTTAYSNYLNERPNTIFSEKAAFALLELLSTSIDSSNLLAFSIKYERYEAGQLAQTLHNHLKYSQQQSYLLSHYADSSVHFFDAKTQKFLDFTLPSISLDSCKWITHDLIVSKVGNDYVLYNRQGEKVLQTALKNFELLPHAWVKWPSQNNYSYQIRHAIHHESLQNQGLDLKIIDAHYYAQENAKGWQLFSVLGEPILEFAVDSIWLENDTYFFKEANKIALAKQRDFQKQSKTDVKSFAFLYTDYAFMEDVIWLASNNYETLLSKENLQILLALQNGEIYEDGDFWFVEKQGVQTIYSNQFSKLYSDKFEAIQVKNNVLGLKKDKKWAILNGFKGNALQYVYDSVRVFSNWLSYVEQDGIRRLIFEDSVVVELEKGMHFRILGTYNTEVFKLNRPVRFVQLTDNRGQSYIYNGLGAAIWKGEVVDVKVLTSELLFLKTRRQSLIVTDNGLTKVLDNGTAVGTLEQGLIPLLYKSKFGAYNIKNSTFIEPISSVKLSVLLEDSIYIYAEKGKLGLTNGKEFILPASYDQLLKVNSNQLFAQANDEWMLIDLKKSDTLIQQLQAVEALTIGGTSYFKVRADSGFGIINTGGKFVVPAIFNALNYYAQQDTLLWVAERNLPEIAYKVMVYFDANGQVLFKKGISQEEFLVNSCD